MCVWFFQAELQKQLDKQREQWDSEVVRLVGCGPLLPSRSLLLSTQSKADQLTERIHSLEIDLKKECVHSTELQVLSLSLCWCGCGCMSVCLSMCM